MPSDPAVVAGSPQKETIISRKPHDYEILPNVLGKGTYSTVFLARNKRTAELLAVKVMNLRLYGREFDSEVSIMIRLAHGGIVGYRFAEVLQDNGYIYMEYVPFPTLYDFIDQSGCGLEESEALAIFSNILDALDFIHNQGIAHKDLKPENVLIDPKTYRVKVMDFGLSVFVETGKLVETFTGSPMYMAPEVLNREAHNPMLADVWSLGVILYQMLVGDSPFCNAESLDELLDLVVFEPRVRLPSFLSHEVRDLLDCMLAHEPKKRHTLFKIKQQLALLMP